jgi:hypothetical protein
MTSAILVWAAGVLFFASAWTNRTSAEMKPEADPDKQKVNLNK